MTTEQYRDERLLKFEELLQPAIIEFAKTQDQMMVNNSYAEKYESALKEIATLLGWVQDTNPNCIGCASDDFDEIALRLVRERWGKSD